MSKIISELTIEGKYKLLVVDEKPSMAGISKYTIDGKDYDPIIAYDMPRGIAIANTPESLVGKEVLFS